MIRAQWNDVVIAESDETVIVEGNHYFPRASVKDVNVRANDRTSVCPWKGTAKYLDVVVNDDVNPAAAWYYPEPKDAATEIAGRVAFWNGVQVTDG